MRRHTSHGLKRSGGSALALALGLTLLGTATAGHAVDGVIEINQAKVEGGSGFPYEISQPGSYRLTGNLTVNENTTAIRITTDNVSLDLNGFAIIGPTVCSGTPPITPLTCDPMPTGSGGGGIVVEGTQTAITVVNGTVRGMGGAGVSVGGHSRIEDVRALSNGGSAITASFSSVLRRNTVNNNGGSGIACGSGCVVSENAVNNNGGSGISAQVGSTVLGNAIRGNVGVGLSLPSFGGDSGYGNNVLNGNNSGGAQVQGGEQLGANVCNGAPCP